MRIQVMDIPADYEVRLMTARWSLAESARDFPDDTIDWYLDLYQRSETTRDLPVCVVAYLDGKLAGSGMLIDDDGLPDAQEPGPWVAAVFVSPPARLKGVGGAIVDQLTTRGHALGFDTLYLYTEKSVDWYEDMGWTIVREAQLAGHPVTVMSHHQPHEAEVATTGA